ncbi:MAG TPA: NUDIX domain-containing protein [Clostridia bacterium]|nr:NUDIX domain-containing protein [Clostridia bacterium]
MTTPAKIVREVSAGGVVLRRIRDRWHVAIIEPNTINADKVTRRASSRPEGTVFALPKGAVDHGETPEHTAAREVWEETGVRAEIISKLTDIKYFYVRSWGGRERVFKIVSFYLFRYASGRLGNIRPEMRVEVRRAFWLPLEEAAAKLTYKGEKQVVALAQKYVREHMEKASHQPRGHE